MEFSNSLLGCHTTCSKMRFVRPPASCESMTQCMTFLTGCVRRDLRAGLDFSTRTATAHRTILRVIEATSQVGTPAAVQMCVFGSNVARFLPLQLSEGDQTVLEQAGEIRS